MDQLSLFDFVDEDAMDSVGSKLQVVKAKFIGTESTDWVELFDGFDELYAITFSSGIDFTCKVVKRFKYAEIIFGCDCNYYKRIAGFKGLHIKESSGMSYQHKSRKGDRSSKCKKA